jgi:adenylate kinase family enzyme
MEMKMENTEMVELKKELANMIVFEEKNETTMAINDANEPTLEEEMKKMTQRKRELKQKKKQQKILQEINNASFNTPMIIGLNGLAGSGKDTIADFLVENYNFKKVSFATILKHIIAIIFSWNREKLDGLTEQDRLWRETTDEWWSSALNIPNFTPRYAMQNIGTNLFRHHFNENIWILSMQRKIEIFLQNNSSNIVITDCRFENEIEFVKKMGGIVVLVKRDASRKEKMNHESERETDTHDATIYNNCSKDELYEEIKKLFLHPLLNKTILFDYIEMEQQKTTIDNNDGKEIPPQNSAIITMETFIKFFKIIPNHSNGNCFFESIRYFYPKLTAKGIRNMVAKYYSTFDMKKEYQENTIEYEIFVGIANDAEDVGTTTPHHINIANEGVWASMTDVLVVALLANVQIVLFMRKGNDVEWTKINPTANKKIGLAFHNYHFEAVCNNTV